MAVLFKDSIYSLQSGIGSKGNIIYKTRIEPFDAAAKDIDLVEVIGKIRKHKSWTADLLQYGMDGRPYTPDGNLSG